MIRDTSSYEANDFAKDFAEIIQSIKPNNIVELGIGNGYSLKCFVENSTTECRIQAYDLFDDFPFNRADEQIIKTMFKDNTNVEIAKADFFTFYSNLEDNSIDILHIDVANNGDVYEFAIENYMDKVQEGGVMMLEGGSEERDNVEWMIKHNKRKINPYLKIISKLYDVKIIDKFPSVTIIKK